MDAEIDYALVQPVGWSIGEERKLNNGIWKIRWTGAQWEFEKVNHFALEVSHQWLLTQENLRVQIGERWFTYIPDTGKWRMRLSRGSPSTRFHWKWARL